MQDLHIEGHCALACGRIREVLARVADKWSVLILYQLGQSPRRFNELKRDLGITQRMLSLTLRDLERDGLIRRTPVSVTPPRVDYALTDLGQSLREPIRGLAQWALANLDKIDAARAAFQEPDDADQN
jgi:DNA-binding HxlR family transcriptional regulator